MDVKRRLIEMIEEKILQPHLKYINVDSGRQCNHKKKRYINDTWRICGNKQELFDEIIKLLGSRDPSDKVITREKRINFTPQMRQSIWERDYGNVHRALCLCCRIQVITERDSQCGHIVSLKEGGDSKEENIAMICSSCNYDMGTTNMDVYIKKIRAINKKTVESLLSQLMIRSYQGKSLPPPLYMYCGGEIGIRLYHFYNFYLDNNEDQPPLSLEDLTAKITRIGYSIEKRRVYNKWFKQDLIMLSSL